MSVVALETLGAEPPPETTPESGSKAVAGKSPTRIAMERLRKDKVAVISGVLVLLLCLAGIFAPVLSKLLGVEQGAGNPGTDTQFGFPIQGPPYYPFTWSHPLGLAPNTGDDNLAELLYGIRTSFAVAFIATVLSTAIGITFGLIGGYAHGWLDRILSFISDVFLSFPFLLGALALAPILTSRFATNEAALRKASFFALISVLVLFTWMPLARLIRGQVLSLREREFVQAAQVVGVPTWRILFKELLPNLVAPIVVATSLSLPAFVTLEAGLSFLGIGLIGIPSLGQTIVRANSFYDSYPLYLWAPVVVIVILVLTLNLLGDSIRDAFDPKTRR